MPDKPLWARLIAWQTVIAAQMYQGLGGFLNLESENKDRKDAKNLELSKN